MPPICHLYNKSQVPNSKFQTNTKFTNPIFQNLVSFINTSLGYIISAKYLYRMNMFKYSKYRYLKYIWNFLLEFTPYLIRGGNDKRDQNDKRGRNDIEWNHLQGKKRTVDSISSNTTFRALRVSLISLSVV